MSLPSFAAVIRLFPPVLILCFTLIGCGSSRSLRVSSNPTLTIASATSVTRIQTDPLFYQAEQAYQQKRFVLAAHLIERLAATPNLSPEQIRFCQTQRAICLRHAGLLPTSTPVKAAAAPAVAPDPDCGPRALALLCRKLGVSASVERLRQLAGTTRQGTSMAGLAKAAHAVRLMAEGVQVSRQGLSEVEMPAIAWVDRRHYVSILDLQGDEAQGTATIQDPNLPHEQRIAQEQLLRLCGGYLLLVHR